MIIIMKMKIMMIKIKKIINNGNDNETDDNINDNNNDNNNENDN